MDYNIKAETLTVNLKNKIESIKLNICEIVDGYTEACGSLSKTFKERNHRFFSAS